MLSGSFSEIIRRAAGDDQAAQWSLFACAAAMMILAPLGATLKRWHHWRDRESDVDVLKGCLFSPIFYFCLIAVVFASVNAYVLQQVYGKSEPNAGVFVGSVLGGLVMMTVHTWLVYRYFSRPKNAPRSRFLLSGTSAVLGDFFLFANMVLFQMVWNMLGSAGLPPPGGVGDFVLRLVALVFLALLVYFPPRVFYLADDSKKPRTWVMIALANLPIVLRLLFGSPAA